MNKTEARYASLLEGLRMAGEIVDYSFEILALVLGPRCTYRPDFAVWPKGKVLPYGMTALSQLYGLVLPPSLHVLEGLEIHETKGGYAREDSLVKIKSASQQFPWFRFNLCRYQKGNWEIKTIA